MQDQQSPATPATPAVPATATQVTVGGATITGAKPADVYAALRAQRRVLNEQLESLENQRGDLAGSLEERERPLDGVARQGVEQRLATVDQRISEVGQQIAVSEREIARVAGIPGAAVEPPPPPDTDGPAEAVAIVGATFTVLVLFPLAIAHARRIWRRGTQTLVALPGEVAERFTRLEQAVETVAIEVERISEGQRFVTNILAEGRAAAAPAPAALGAGAAQPIEVRVPQGERVYRGGTG